VFTIATLLLAVPYLVYAILQCAIPELAEIRQQTLWVGLALVVVLVGLTGLWGDRIMNGLNSLEGSERRSLIE